MRQAYAHRARIAMEPGGDVRAPGGAITLALCGAWEHEPPCPIAPHHTDTAGDPADLTVTVVFACEPGDAEAVRRTVVAALASGATTGPDGTVSRWSTTASEAVEVDPTRADLAARLSR